MTKASICLTAARQVIDSTGIELQPLGQGLINDTFLVSSKFKRFVLQRINNQVFLEPLQVMSNLRVLTDHAKRIDLELTGEGWRLPEIVTTLVGSDFYVDSSGDYWRGISFIEGSKTLSEIQSPNQAEQVGYCLGRFHRMASTIPEDRLFDTLPDFHVTPRYLERFDQWADAQYNSEVDHKGLIDALRFVEEKRDSVDVLEIANQRGHLRTSVIHVDPKLDNILFDLEGQSAVSIIDLDTVKPGLIHYDLGDCIRSCCSDRSQALIERFNVDRLRSLLKGYFLARGDALSTADKFYLYDAIRLLPFELGLRFLTDHLMGNLYFKVDYPNQNLERALEQFKIVMSIDRQESCIRRLLEAVS